MPDAPQITDSGELCGMAAVAASGARWAPLFSLNIWNVTLAQGASEITYANPVIVLPLYKHGDVTYRHNTVRRRAVFHPGQTGIFPAGFTHSCEPELAHRFCELVLPQDMLREKCAALELPPPRAEGVELVPSLAIHDPHLHHFVSALAAEVATPDCADGLYVEYLLDWIAVRMLTRYRGEVASPALERRWGHPKMDRALEYAHDNLQDCAWQLRDWAASVQMSVFHFARLFRATTGYSPHQYVLRHRMSLAKTLLTHTTQSVLEVCLNSGFQNASHFATVFRRHTRLSPLRYRTLTRR